VDLTNSETAPVCNKQSTDHGTNKVFLFQCVSKIFYIRTDHPQQQQKKVKDVSTESAGTQTPAVLSIKIAKVQENVQWENEGKRFLLKYILWLPMQSLWTSL